MPRPTPIPTPQMDEYMRREAETIARIQDAEATVILRQPIEDATLVNTDGVQPIDLYREDPYSDIEDLVHVGGSDRHKTLHRPNGGFMSRYELEQVQANQGHIRNTADDRGKYGEALPQPINPRLPRIAGGASIDAFLDPTNSPETAELRGRANYLQSVVENILRAIPEKKANSISLENELNRHSQEFTCLVSSAEFEKEQSFTLKEGGLKLLEKGLIAGVVPTLDQLGRLQNLFNNQQIDKVMQDKNGNSHPGFTTNPRYLRRGLPGFGPYSSPEDDTVERISQLIEPNTWELTNEDEAYLLRLLNTDELTKYKHAPAPSGQVHFWNREPFNFYLKKESKDFTEKRHGRPSIEEQRQQKMADPTVRADIALSNSIINWWRSSVGKTYVGKSAIEKANLDQTMIKDIKAYIKARIDLSDQI